MERGMGEDKPITKWLLWLSFLLALPMTGFFVFAVFALAAKLFSVGKSYALGYFFSPWSLLIVSLPMILFLAGAAIYKYLENKGVVTILLILIILVEIFHYLNFFLW